MDAPGGPAPTAPNDGGYAPGASPPILAGGDALALEIGHAVLAVLQKAAADGQLPPAFSQLRPSAADVALEPRPGTVIPLAPPVAKPRPRPGTATVRHAMRRAQQLAMAPAGSEMAQLRMTLLAVLLCLTLVFGAVFYAVFYVAH